MNLLKINMKKKMSVKERAQKIKADIPTLFLALRDKDTPAAAKILAAMTVAYALSPIDLIPDFIPVLGCLDDLILLPVLIALTIKLIPKKILEKNRKAAKEVWTNEKLKKWYFAIPILLIWMFVIALILKAILR